MPKALSSESIVYQCWVLDSIGSKGCIGDIESFKLHLRSTNISYLRFHIVCQCWVDLIGSREILRDIQTLSQIKKRKPSFLSQFKKNIHCVSVFSVEWTPLDLRDASGDIESYSNFISGQENINCVSTLSQIKKRDISTLSQIKKTFIVYQCWVLSGLNWI